MMDRERPSASDTGGKIPEAWIGQEVMLETTETLSSDLLEKGMGLGAVVALVVTGMGVSLPEVSMLAGLFRIRLVAVLVASVFVVAIGSGTIFAPMGV
jgi:uncharacterized membrane protein YraQ (UPF0718 family)